MRHKNSNSKKYITNRQMSGQQGINLLEKIALDMGIIWRPTEIHDAGIDGEFEIRNPETGEVTNCIIKVQSKVISGIFTAEKENSFEYLCEPKDIDYWLGGNIPVILVVSRPNKNEAYWIHINEYFKDPQKRNGLRVYFDKVKNKLSKDSFNELVNLGVPINSGIYFPPPQKEETLYSNLLKVKDYPASIYLAETDLRKADRFWARANDHNLKMPNEWTLRNQSILSFHDLREKPWDFFCDRGSVEEHETDDWALSEDEDKKRIFVELLNRCLDTKLRRHTCSYRKQSECYYIWATKNKKTRVFIYKSHQKETQRNIFEPYESKTTEGRIAYFRHSAFQGNFVRYDNQWYLEINPTYVFTSDGYKESKYSAERLSTIKRMEKNDAVCGQTLMWSRYLTQPRNFFVAEYEMLKFDKLVEFSMTHSIQDQLWLQRNDMEAAQLPQDDSGSELF